MPSARTIQGLNAGAILADPACSHDSGPHTLHRDYETRGVLALSKVGAHRYAADPRTEVLCCAYAVDNGPVQTLDAGRCSAAGIHRSRQQSELDRGCT